MLCIAAALASCGEGKAPSAGEPCDDELGCAEGLVCVDGVCQTGGEFVCEQNCSDLDGWYDVDVAYACCDGEMLCECQEQEYRTFACVEQECDFRVTDERTTASDCETCDDTNPCTIVECVDGACVGTDLPAGTSCGVDGECDGAGVCSEACTIDGLEYPDGTVNPENECQYCDVSADRHGWTNRADGTTCGVSDPCFVSSCEAGVCVDEAVPGSTEPISIEGTDAVCSGGDADLRAKGGDHLNDAVYEWGVGECGDDPFEGETEATLELEGLETQTEVWVRRMDPCAGPTPCAYKTVAIAPVPERPTGIEGPTRACEGNASTTYRVENPVVRLTYIWTVPDDWTITAGQNTAEITVTPGANSGSVSVVPQGDCGAGPPRSLQVTSRSEPNQPGAIIGDEYVCEGIERAFSIDTVPSTVSYVWEYSGEGTPVGSGTTVALAATSDGVLRVRAANPCGESDWREHYITVDETSVGGYVEGPADRVCAGSPTGPMVLRDYVGSVQRWEADVDQGGWEGIPSQETWGNFMVQDVATYYFRTVVKSGTCEEVASQAWEVEGVETVGGQVTGTVSQACSGEDMGALTLENHQGQVVKWQAQQFGSSNWYDIDGSEDQTRIEPTSTHQLGTYVYRAMVENAPCDSEPSSEWTISVVWCS